MTRDLPELNAEDQQTTDACLPAWKGPDGGRPFLTP